MNELFYYRTVFGMNHMGDMPSDVCDVEQPAIMGDLVFHNVKVFNHFFAKGVNKWG